MAEMIICLTEVQFTELNEKLDEIKRLAVSGILGNARVSLADIKNVSDQAKDILLEATIENDGPDAA